MAVWLLHECRNATQWSQPAWSTVYYLKKWNGYVLGCVNSAHKYDRDFQHGKIAHFMNAYLIIPNGKMAKEAMLLLLHYGKRQSDLWSKLTAFANNCGNQNKNNTVLRMAAHWVECGHFKEVEIVFLVVGHNTKNACGRLFNSMKVDYRQMDVWSPFTQLACPQHIQISSSTLSETHKKLLWLDKAARLVLQQNMGSRQQQRSMHQRQSHFLSRLLKHNNNWQGIEEEGRRLSRKNHWWFFWGQWWYPHRTRMTLLGMLSQKNKVLSSMTVRKKDSGGVIANGGDVAITPSQQPQTPIIVRNDQFSNACSVAQGSSSKHCEQGARFGAISCDRVWPTQGIGRKVQAEGASRMLII